MAPASLYQSPDSAWVNWTASSATTYANTTYVNVDVWKSWVYQRGTYTSATSVWRYWTGAGSQPAFAPQPQVRAPTAEELRIAEARVVERRRRDEEYRVATRVAAEKSFKLLESLLDEEQRRMFEEKHFFHVHTRNGQRTYELRRDGPPRLIKSETGDMFSFCIHPRESFPRGDELAALKLMLEADEAKFLSTANASRLARVA